MLSAAGEGGSVPRAQLCRKSKARGTVAGRKPDSAKPTSRPHTEAYLKDQGRAEACEGGLGASVGTLFRSVFPMRRV